MSYALSRAAAAAVTVVLTALGLAAAAGWAAAAPAPGTPASSTSAHRANVRAACPAAVPGRARCFAEVRTDVHGGMGVRGPAALAAGTRRPPHCRPGTGQPTCTPPTTCPPPAGGGRPSRSSTPAMTPARKLTWPSTGPVPLENRILSCDLYLS
jgi:hypothetical protein